MSKFYPNPATETLLDRLANIEAALLAANPIVDQSILGGRIAHLRLATPAAPTIVVTGAGSGTQVYAIVALLGSGHTAAGPTATTGGAGPTTLGATHFNTLSWAPVPGATSYNVYRTTGGASQGLIANVVDPNYGRGSANLSLVDNGLGGDSTSAPAMNSTGIIQAAAAKPVQVIAADGAVTGFGLVLITKTSTAAAITLNQPVAGAPSAGGDDGLTLDLVDTVGASHTVTTGTNGIVGSKHILTFGGTVNNTAKLVAYNGTWYVVDLGGGALS